MTLQTFVGRLENGKSNSLTYHTTSAEGLVNVWKLGERYIVTIEECPPGQQFDEAEYTKDERVEFMQIGHVIEFLQAQGFDIKLFVP